ncbi:MAG: hypothetical protein VYE61_07235 [Pseudomonadota bacterium]|nr:hypothetical protein [Pseudomonadota bacterium]
MSFICSILSIFPSFRQLFKIAALGAVLAGCLAPLSILSASERTGWFSDVPLINSVTVDTQLSFAFDSPSGRILVLHLQTQAEDKDIQVSYHNTLAAIGWTTRDDHFVKGDELLRLQKINVGGELLWRLTIIPKSANQLEIR